MQFIKIIANYLFRITIRMQQCEIHLSFGMNIVNPE
jgi:hypothetical protein